MVESGLVRALLQAQDADRPTGTEEATRALREELLRTGSSTPDNLSAATQVEYGEVAGEPGSPRTAGLKLSGTDILLADVLNAAEGSATPPEVRESFPELTQEQWDAVLRWTTMLMISLEAAPPPSH